MSLPHRTRPSQGFTLVESLVALAIALMACSALSLSLTSAFQHTEHALEQTIAEGLAEQLMDEVLGRPITTTDSPGGSGRAGLGGIKDFDGYRHSSLTDPWDIPLGKDDGQGGQRHARFTPPSGELDRWEQQIDVYHVEDSDPAQRRPAHLTSNLIAVEVRIYKRDLSGNKRLLTTLRRVVSSLPRF